MYFQQALEELSVNPYSFANVGYYKKENIIKDQFVLVFEKMGSELTVTLDSKQPNLITTLTGNGISERFDIAWLQSKTYKPC